MRLVIEGETVGAIVADSATTTVNASDSTPVPPDGQKRVSGRTADPQDRQTIDEILLEWAEARSKKHEPA